MTETQLPATLLANGPYARDDAPFALLDVLGPDAGAFLQRLCSQDVVGLDDGQLAPAAFLDAKGKLVCTVLVWRRGDGFRLETHQEQLERLFELLERYHFTEKLSIAKVEQGGCHEYVARIHTYGHVNRKLCLLQLGGGDAIEAPATLLEPEDELPVGRVMHAVPVAGHDLRVGLGYLPKDFQALGTRLQLEDGGVATVVGFGDAADD